MTVGVLVGVMFATNGMELSRMWEMILEYGMA